MIPSRSKLLVTVTGFIALATLAGASQGTDVEPLPDITGQLPIFDYEPDFSPDGKRIVFGSIKRDGDANSEWGNPGTWVYTANSDGSNVQPLRFIEETSNVKATWSPDGEKIAFVSKQDGDTEIYLMNIDGSDVVQLTDNTDEDQDHAAWAPDGTRIAFNREFADGSASIYVMNADGSGEHKILDLAQGGGLVAWGGPREGKLVYSALINDDRELFIMDPDGANPGRLTDTPGNDRDAELSPDGNSVVYITDRDENWEIYILDIATGEERRLTRNADNDFDPSFSPDGKRILWASTRDGRGGIYTMNLDGSDKTKLTNKAMSPIIDAINKGGLENALARYEASQAANADAPYFFEGEIKNVARRMMRDGEADDGLRLLQLNADTFPDSIRAFIQLGMAEEQLGRTGQATANFDRAWAIYSERPNQRHATLADLRERLRGD